MPTSARAPSSSSNLVSGVLLLLIALLFIKLSLAYVGAAYSIGETSADPGGIPFRWAIKGLIPVGFGLLALHAVASLCRLVLAERSPAGGRPCLSRRPTPS